MGSETKVIPENLGCCSWWRSGTVVMFAQRFFAIATEDGEPPEIKVEVVFFAMANI